PPAAAADPPCGLTRHNHHNPNAVENRDNAARRSRSDHPSSPRAAPSPNPAARNSHTAAKVPAKNSPTPPDNPGPPSGQSPAAPGVFAAPPIPPPTSPTIVQSDTSSHDARLASSPHS